MAEVRCYTPKEVRAKLQLTQRALSRLEKAGKLPFLEELTPRLGRYPRYRADLIDRYLAGQWASEASRFFAHGRRRVWNGREWS